MRIAAALLCAFCLLNSARAAEPVFSAFEEDLTKNDEFQTAAYKKKKQESGAQDILIGSARLNYRQFSERVVVPGFISSSPLTEIAKLAGPNNLTASYRIGDTLYFQWVGTPGPREGDRWAIYTPAVVLQSTLDPTEFSIKTRPARLQELPENVRLAGFFYETNGVARITRINRGMAEAVIEKLSGQVSAGDQLMPILPVKKEIRPAVGGIQLSAAVVAGSPADRLSTTKNSFIYINRGSRDGIREGRVLQAVESVSVDRAISGMAPEVSLGEAIVVHVSDSYSTAKITKQFDVIRIGSLLRTKQEFSNITSKAPFTNFVTGGSVNGTEDYVEIPTMGDLETEIDPTLPDPVKRQNRPATKPELSELDALEKAQKFDALSPEERSRLGKLSRQEKMEEKSEDDINDLGTPLPAPVDNSFRQDSPKKNDKKKKKKTAPSANDEEELNQLMMQN
jgi:hypothetical protein